MKGLIDPEESDRIQTHSVIINDLMDSNDLIDAANIRASHHNSSVFYPEQNLLYQGRGHRNCSLNAHYMIVLGSARDRNQIVTLRQKLFPNQKHYR